MSWASLSGLTDDNPENRVAGNADDRVKHAVYLAALTFLLERDPWRQGMSVHECHAGRGIYEVDGGAYAGSAARVTSLLDVHAAAHDYEAYEWDPRTRRILREVIGAERVLGDHGDARFDGETHIADHIEGWNERHVVLMDPFGIWERDKLEHRRARYRRIFGALAEHELRPVWLLFLTWKNALPPLTEQPRIAVTWDFGVRCAVWVAPPAPLLEPLRVRIVGELAQARIVEGGEGGGHELPRVDII